MPRDPAMMTLNRAPHLPCNNSKPPAQPKPEALNGPDDSKGFLERLYGLEEPR